MWIRQDAFSGPVQVSCQRPSCWTFGSEIFYLQDIRGLDLSQNLLRSWIAVAQITKELPLLQRLSLKYVIF